jgi:hypothetical protein
MEPLTVNDLLVYLDSVQRAYGGDLECWVRTEHGGAGVAQRLTDATVQAHDPGEVLVVLCGATPAGD